MNFREIDTGFKNAAWNMAMDQTLLELQEGNEPCLRFLSFSPSCALVGYFQSVEQEIREEYCKKEGIDINRRITGGGAIYFDPSQLGWEIIASIPDFPYTFNDMFRTFGEVVAEALRMLGIPAEFKPRNDIEVRGKKISGMGGISLKDSFLFQGTLLVEDRINELLHSLKVPIEKLKPKEIDSVRERVTCIERELGRVPDREELKDTIRKAMKKRFGVEIIHRELTSKEIERHRELLPKFTSDNWIYKISLPKNTQGMISGIYRASSGTIKVNIIVNAAQKMIRSTYITGDFFCEPGEAIYDMERLIKNIRWNEDKILGIIEDFFNSSSITGIGVEDMKNAFKEVFSKFKWIEMGFSLEETNHIFTVNLESGEKFYPEVFLLPYCAKDPDCGFRHKRECPVCGKCTVGDAYLLSQEIGIEPITILSFEDLMDTFDELKRRGIRDYIGSCCEAFYVKHQEDFRNSGLRGLLIDIENSTCYDLGKAKEAYLGKFESRTDLNFELIKKMVNMLVRRKDGQRIIQTRR